ncbi:helix-turn-helix domain-containing protein [Agromyces sp. NPDC049794]|uniref:helix-turn-helix domain-containing protein n=1 Tax=unclassified Agromyces TaxID=2639701 RepID=UPI0033CD663D
MTTDIGLRLREARKSRGMSLRSVAQSLGVSASLVSQVETGKTQPSVSTLYALVNHLGISLDDVMGVAVKEAAPTPRGAARYLSAASRSAIQRAEDNPVLEMENGVRWERLAVGEEGPVDVLLVTYEPGGSSSIEGKLMRHAGVEYGYLIEGELTMQLEFDTHVLRAGDSLHFDSVRPHLYSNRGTVPARGVWFVVGRREHADTMPDQAGTRAVHDGSLGSAVDVLRAMDRL